MSRRLVVALMVFCFSMVSVAPAVDIVLVSEDIDNDGDGAFDDQDLVNWLVAEGHFVAVDREIWKELDPNKIAALNTADLIVVSRTTGSGSYDDDDEPTQWNSITTPIMQMSAYLLRSSRWKWVDSSSAIGQGGAPIMQVVDAGHPVFAGVALDPNDQVQVLDPSVGIGHTSFVDINDVGNGILIATTADNGLVWIAEWAPGVAFYDGAGQVPAGPRMSFLAGTQEISGTVYGAPNLTAEGLQMLSNAIAYLLSKDTAWTYVYEGDAAVAGEANANDSLDGTWDHDNGSDAWDGTSMGEGAPGGAAALVEGDVDFLRIQDTGDPRGLGFDDPSNRKVYLTRDVNSDLDGMCVEFRIRVATTEPLDGLSPDEAWPVEGVAYHIRDNGKGMIGVGQSGVGIISFSLAREGEPGLEGVFGDVLVMNNLVAAEASGDVDTADTADTIVAKNYVAVDDVTQWNTFRVDVAAGGAGTHQVAVSVNGGPAETFDVTVGGGAEADGGFIAVGSSGTGGVTAFDVDYVAFRAGTLPQPEPEPEPEPVTRR